MVTKDTSGRETVHSKADFDAGHDSAAPAETLVDKFERAFASNVPALHLEKRETGGQQWYNLRVSSLCVACTA